MKTQTPLIAIAVFAIAILLSQVFYIEPAYAQVTIESVDFGSTVAFNEFTNCDYISSSQVWCASSTGIKVWNPTSRTVLATLKPTGNFDDIACTSSVCYGWEVSGITGNLTRWLVSDRSLDDFQAFVGNAGLVTGHGIGLVEGGSDNTLLLPVEGQTCTDGITPLGGTNEKGICFWNGGSGVLFDGLRFVSSGQTADTNIVYDVKWNGGSGLFGNRGVVTFRDTAGNFFFYNLNLGDGDSTFATTQICVTGSLSSVLSSQAKTQIIDGILYHAYSTSDIVVMDTTLDTCTTATKSNPVDESTFVSITEDSTTGNFIVSAKTADGSGSEAGGLYVFNSTLSGINAVAERIVKVNLTANTPDHINLHFNHASEGEVHVWRGSNMLIITDILEPAFEGGETTTICFVTETGTEICVEYELDEQGRPILPSVIGGVNPRNITDTTGEFFCSIGLTDCDNPDIQTNGVGMFMLLLLVLVSYALVVYIHHVARQSVMGIHPMLVLLIGIIDVSIAFFLGWIPDYVFYSVIVLLIGLGGFGLYRIIRGM